MTLENGLPTESQEKKDLKGTLAKRRPGIKTSIENIVNAIAEGRTSKALRARLEKLEQDEQEVTVALMKVEREIEKENVKRPTAEQVQASWCAVLDAWPHLTEAKREEVLRALVDDVEVKEKDR